MHKLPLDFDPELDLALQRDLALAPARVWQAWTRPELLMQWFCPAPWRVSECELDLRPGGIFRTVMEGPAGERHDSAGCFLEVVPEHRLVWTDALLPGFRPAATSFMTGELILSHDGTGTGYLAIARHASPEAREQHEAMGFHQGWGAALDQLVELMENL